MPLISPMPSWPPFGNKEVTLKRLPSAPMALRQTTESRFRGEARPLRVKAPFSWRSVNWSFADEVRQEGGGELLHWRAVHVAHEHVLHGTKITPYLDRIVVTFCRQQRLESSSVLGWLPAWE